MFNKIKGGGFMNLYQNGVFIITVVSSLLLIFLSLVKPNNSGKWVKAYSILPEKEKKKYNPVIVLNRMKKILLLITIIGAVGLVLSILINEKLIILTSILIFVLFTISIQYAGLKSGLIDKD